MKTPEELINEFGRLLVNHGFEAMGGISIDDFVSHSKNKHNVHRFATNILMTKNGLLETLFQGHAISNTNSFIDGSLRNWWI